MSKRATHPDAQLILQLYDLRREAEMRKARNWWLKFNPQSADDFLQIAMDFGSQENAWFRQVMGYWSMAASLVLSGAVNQDLFLDPSVSGEMFLIYAKTRPYLKEIRNKMKNPHIFANIEELITSARKGRETLKRMEAMIAARRERMMAQGKTA